MGRGEGRKESARGERNGVDVFPGEKSDEYYGASRAHARAPYTQFSEFFRRICCALRQD